MHKIKKQKPRCLAESRGQARAVLCSTLLRGLSVCSCLLVVNADSSGAKVLRASDRYSVTDGPTVATHGPVNVSEDGTE